MSACMGCGQSYRLSLIINILNSLFNDIIHIQFFSCLVGSYAIAFENLPQIIIIVTLKDNFAGKLAIVAMYLSLATNG